MRFPLSAKLAAVAVLFGATWFVTSSANARRAVAKVDQPRGGEALTKTAVKNPAPANLEAGGKPGKVVASSHTASYKIEAEGNQVHVFAAIELKDSRTGAVSYMWRLRAFPQGSAVAVVDVPYKGQIFEVPAAGELNPTFDETFQLPQGTYKVQLNLYEFPKGYDLRLLDDDQKAMGQWIANLHKIITIK